jgi:hypothetical protein
MQRNNFFDKTVVVVLASKVKLTNRHGVVASVAQAVSPTAHAAIVGMSIVPAMIFRNVRASVQASPSRHTDRAICIRCIKPRSARRKRIKVRRLNKWVSVTAGHITRVFI